jgi:AcrR family transcriptional regulator
MVYVYKKPLQPRARATEQRFLDALHDLLIEKSLGQLTIDDIADRAQLTRSAFLGRFGTKKQALFVLYERYCAKVFAVMDEILLGLPRHMDAVDVCIEMSKHAERLQTADFPANRAMHEIFQENLTVDVRTKELFLGAVELMRKTQKMFVKEPGASDVGAFAAAQLLLTLNYNYVLKGMPGFPRDAEVRHQLIGRLLAETLKI